MTWSNICLIPVNPSTLNLETQVSDLWYTKFLLAYTSTNTRFYACHIQGKNQLRTYLLPVTDWYDSFVKYPIPVRVRHERRNKKPPIPWPVWYVQKYITLQHLSRLQTERQELSIHVKHTGGRDALPIHVVKVETIVSYSCLELQSSEFRHHIWCIFSQGQLFTFLQKIPSMQSKIFD
jgi:hypothetical protein